MKTLNPNLLRTMSPPVMQAREWLEKISPKSKNCLLNMSQAAPTEPPHPHVKNAMAQALVNDPTLSVYGPVFGKPELRNEVARNWSQIYNGDISSSQVAITSGCNQAFKVISTVLATPRDTVMITAPWYFNHKMCLDMLGIQVEILDLEEDLTPSLKRAEKQFNKTLKAIVLISPNNPCGLSYSPELIQDFYNFAKEKGIYLIIDETYRDFIDTGIKPHNLFSDPHWPETLIHLFSFSKSYRLAGYRLGCFIANTQILQQAEKVLDTDTICPNQIGQVGALFGLQNLSSWLSDQREIILERKRLIETGFKNLTGWNLLSCGSYFAYIKHHFDVDSETLVKRLLEEENLLVLPDIFFENPEAKQDFRKIGEHVRVAFANANNLGIEEFFKRLKRFTTNNSSQLRSS